MTYQPAEYALLAAPVTPIAAKAFVSMFSREQVLAAAALQEPAARAEIRRAWAAIEAMAKVFDSMREERPGYSQPPAPAVPQEPHAPAGLSVEEAALAIGCTTGRVRQLLRAGILEGSKAFRGCWIVDPDSVAAFRVSRELAA